MARYSTGLAIQATHPFCLPAKSSACSLSGKVYTVNSLGFNRGRRSHHRQFAWMPREGLAYLLDLIFHFPHAGVICRPWGRMYSLRLTHCQTWKVLSLFSAGIFIIFIPHKIFLLTPFILVGLYILQQISDKKSKIFFSYPPFLLFFKYDSEKG